MDGLEGIWNVLTRCYEHQVGASVILYALVKVRGSWVLLFVVSKTPCSLSVNYEACIIG